MKKIFFKEEENLSEKAFIQGIMTCVFSIIFCLIALCSVTWAWYRTDLSSASNTIQTGTYNLEIIIEDAELKSSTTSSYTYELKPDIRYQINMNVEPYSVKNGYCKIKIADQYLYTDIISDQFSAENPFSFYFMIHTEDKNIMESESMTETEGTETQTETVTETEETEMQTETVTETEETETQTETVTETTETEAEIPSESLGILVTFEWHWGIYSGEPDIFNQHDFEYNLITSES